MRNARTPVGVRPLSARIANPPAGIAGVYWPLTGGGSTAINLAAITKGYPTVVRLGSAASCRAGQVVKVVDAGGMTEVNGYHRVLWVNGSDVALDVDSGGFTTYTSAGQMHFNVLYDVFGPASGRVPAQDLQGTLTNIWANPTDGLTPDGSGTRTNLMTSGVEVFDLDGFDGLVVIGFMCLDGATPSNSEYLFGIGRQTVTGTHSETGNLAVAHIGAAAQLSLSFRPRTAAAGEGTNTLAGATAPSNGTLVHVAFVVDCRAPTAPVLYSYLNGAQKASSAATMTNATGLPTVGSAGVTFGADITNVLGYQYVLGANSGGNRYRNFAFLKLDSRYDLTDATKIIKDFSRYKELVL